MQLIPPEPDLDLIQAPDWNEAELSAAVRRFIMQPETLEDADTAYAELYSVGARTHATLRALMGNPDLPNLLIRHADSSCHLHVLLNVCPDPWMIPYLIPLLSLGVPDYFRYEAAYTLGNIGGMKIAPLLSKVLAEDHQAIRFNAICGLHRAFKEERINTLAALELFPIVQPLFTPWPHVDAVASLLVRFNETAAFETFFSEPVFQAESPLLYPALWAFAEVRARVPHDSLHQIIHSLVNTELTQLQEQALAEALELLGLHRLEDDYQFLMTWAHSNWSVAAIGASRGLLHLRSLIDYESELTEIYHEALFEGRPPHEVLTEVQLKVLSVLLLENEVQQGGLEQYFCSPASNYWNTAALGLEMINCHKSADILTSTGKLLHAHGPADSLNKRQAQVHDLMAESPDKITSLTSSFLFNGDDRYARLNVYVANHADVFR